MPDYKKIPVTLDTYAKIAIIAEANGFGERGMGAQLTAWATRELPECNHKKNAVTIETFPKAPDALTAVSHVQTGWLCPTCKRVYAHALTGTPEELVLPCVCLSYIGDNGACPKHGPPSGSPLKGGEQAVKVVVEAVA